MPNKIEIIIGQNIRKHRAWAGFNQEELGKHLGITAQQISKFERGENRITASQLLQIANTLGISVQTLLGEVFKALPTTRSDHQFMRDYKELPRGTQETLRELVRAIVSFTEQELKK